MKIQRKIVGIVIMLICLLITNTVLGNTSNNILIATQKEGETAYLENDQGSISKKITSIEEENGTVNIEINLANLAKDTQTYKSTEIVLVIDNSLSMDYKTLSGETRKNIVIDSAKKLAQSVLKTADNVKIGIVKFHTRTYNWESVGIENADIITKLTGDENTVISGLNKVKNISTESGTNIDAGIQKAKSMFSKECENKIIVLLTDGVPNADVKGNDTRNDTTTEEAKVIQTNTKETIQKLKDSQIYLISLMTGINKEDIDASGNSQDSSYQAEAKAVEYIFGTPEKPTAGRFYLTKTVDIDSVVNKDILKDITTKIQKPIHNIKIEDYFPTDICHNFEFSYVNKPTIGTISDKIDEEKNNITYTLEELKGDKNTSISYQLKLKDINNTELMEKVIATNEKVVLTYQDTEEKEYTVTLNDSPKIKLTKQEIEESTNTENNTQDNNHNAKDNTLAGGNIPQTGNKVGMIIEMIVIITVMVVIRIRSKKYKDIQ